MKICSRFRAVSILLFLISGTHIFCGNQKVSAAAEEEIKRELKEFFFEMNGTWATHGDVDSLVKYWHPELVMITPDKRNPIKGRASAMKYYREFLASTKIIDWKDTDIDIKLYDYATTAILTCNYEMTLEADGNQFQAAGRDMQVFAKENGSWWLIADQFSGFPEQ